MIFTCQKRLQWINKKDTGGRSCAGRKKASRKNNIGRLADHQACFPAMPSAALGHAVKIIMYSIQHRAPSRESRSDRPLNHRQAPLYSNQHGDRQFHSPTEQHHSWPGMPPRQGQKQGPSQWIFGLVFSWFSPLHHKSVAGCIMFPDLSPCNTYLYIFFKNNPHQNDNRMPGKSMMREQQRWFWFPPFWSDRWRRWQRQASGRGNGRTDWRNRPWAKIARKTRVEGSFIRQCTYNKKFRDNLLISRVL